MQIVTLISDWNENSIYISVIKGALYSNIQDVKIVDINHSIEQYNLNQGAFLLKSVYKNFPEGTIHLICLKSESPESDYIVIKSENQYFVSNNNGIFGLISDRKPQEIYKIKSEMFEETTFPELSIFVKIATNICNKNDFSKYFDKTDTFKKMFPIEPTFDEDVIIGKIIHIDAYKNVITNISKELFENVRKEREFSISFKSNRYKLEKINTKYCESENGEFLAIFNSFGLLEIAQYHGRIAEFLNMDEEKVVRINFF